MKASTEDKDKPQIQRDRVLTKAKRRVRLEIRDTQ